jgi:hypothetical protein
MATDNKKKTIIAYTPASISISAPSLGVTKEIEILQQDYKLYNDDDGKKKFPGIRDLRLKNGGPEYIDNITQFSTVLIDEVKDNCGTLYKEDGDGDGNGVFNDETLKLALDVALSHNPNIVPNLHWKKEMVTTLAKMGNKVEAKSSEKHVYKNNKGKKEGFASYNQKEIQTYKDFQTHTNQHINAYNTASIKQKMLQLLTKPSELLKNARNKFKLNEMSKDEAAIRQMNLRLKPHYKYRVPILARDAYYSMSATWSGYNKLTEDQKKQKLTDKATELGDKYKAALEKIGKAIKQQQAEIATEESTTLPNNESLPKQLKKENNAFKKHGALNELKLLQAVLESKQETNTQFLRDATKYNSRIEQEATMKKAIKECSVSMANARNSASPQKYQKDHPNASHHVTSACSTTKSNAKSVIEKLNTRKSMLPGSDVWINGMRQDWLQRPRHKGKDWLYASLSNGVFKWHEKDLAKIALNKQKKGIRVYFYAEREDSWVSNQFGGRPDILKDIFDDLSIADIEDILSEMEPGEMTNVCTRYNDDKTISMRLRPKNKDAKKKFLNLCRERNKANKNKVKVEEENNPGVDTDNVDGAKIEKNTLEAVNAETTRGPKIS